MSPASRRPAGKRTGRATRRTDLTLVPAPAEPCDCPACTGEPVDPAELFDGLASLAGCEDAVEAELSGAILLTMATAAGDAPAFVRTFVEQAELAQGAGTLALLLAVDAVIPTAQPEVAGIVHAATERLAATGTPAPAWARELAAELLPGECLRLDHPRSATTVLTVAFERAGRGHTFVVFVDEAECGAAEEILVVDTPQVPELLDEIREDAASEGVDLRTTRLGAAELRWYVEQALAARDVHDEESPIDPVAEMILAEDDDEDGPPYPPLALLLRARLATLPPARRPRNAKAGKHAAGHGSGADALSVLTSLLAEAGQGGRGGRGGAPGGLAGLPGGLAGLPGGRAGLPGGRAGGLGRLVSPPLPAKRKKAAGPAPVYQIKVGLRGAKPPIWRRLLVPADVNLARLHQIIQAAFGWHGGHMHVFETPYGEFGHADRELGHRAEAPVTLEQVAPQAKAKIRYTYDFGDDWEHDIVVEQVLERDRELTYPHCTGGRRAAPPDDCGGIWGYAELVEILADPAHPEHEERLEWLGLVHAGEFDPAEFDVDEVNEALADVRLR